MENANNTSPYSPLATAAIAIIISFMMVVTIVGNILVIVAVLTSRSLKGAQNLFLISLAAADILVATLIIPFSLANELQGQWVFGSIWCEIYLALDVLFCTSSIVHLCAIAMDRYLSISRPVSYGTRRTPLQIKVAIVMVWLISAVISFPALLTLENMSKGEKCKLNEKRWYILYSSIGSFFAPCVIMILVYARIYQIAKQHTRCPPGQIPGAEPVARSPDRVNENQEGSVRRDKVFTPTSPSGSNQSSLRKPAETSAVKKASKDLQWEAPIPPVPQVPTIPSVSPAEHSGREGEANPNHMSSSGSEDELEIGVKANISKENTNKPDGRALGSSPNEGDKVQVLDQACRYKNTVTTMSGTRLAPTDTPTSSRRKAMANREKRFTFVLAVVMGVFVICWFPFFLSYSLKAVCPDTCSIPESLFTFFFWIGYCNSCLNPIIYTVFNKDFRKAFKRILSRDTKGTFF